MPPTSRRALLKALAGAGLGAAGSTALAGCGETASPRGSRASRHRYRYADDHEDQFGDLRLPAGRIRGTVVLLHGGFWLDDYGLDLMDPLADAVTALRLATWNVEYRRLRRGGGWPATFTDVATAVDHLESLAQEVRRPLSDHVLLLGHSAGGHLAVWAASRTRRTPGGAPRVTVRGTVSLSGVLDLTRASRQSLGGGAVDALLGGDPSAVPGHYRLGDPTLLVPAASPVWAVHGRDDITVPLAQSRAYVASARAAGAQAELIRVPGEHLDLIDPSRPAWPTVRRLVAGAGR